MLKQNYSKVKKILILLLLLLAVFFVTTLTISTVSAADNSVTEVTQLEQINASLQKGPVLLEIGSEHCGPCQAMMPMLKELATEYAGRATIMTIDIDKSPDLADYFGVSIIPDSTVIVGIKNGKYFYMKEDGNVSEDRSYAKIRGLTDKNKLENVLNLALNYKKAPVAAFSVSLTSGNSPLKVQFTDKSTGSPTSWKWNFGDGSTSTSKSPAHTYSKVGKYTVSLTVKNAAGSSTKTIKNYITVKSPVKPVAAFSASPRSGTKPLKVQFTDKSTGSPTSWKWNFGDGTTSTTHNPLHTYIKKGKLTVTLTATNAAGSSTKTMTSYITVK